MCVCMCWQTIFLPSFTHSLYRTFTDMLNFFFCAPHIIIVWHTYNKFYMFSLWRLVEVFDFYCFRSFVRFMPMLSMGERTSNSHSPCVRVCVLWYSEQKLLHNIVVLFLDIKASRHFTLWMAWVCCIVCMLISRFVHLLSNWWSFWLWLLFFPHPSRTLTTTTTTANRSRALI